MGTTAAILSILAALVPFLVWVYKRQAAKHDNPILQKEKQDEAIDHAIATDDVAAINVFIHDKLQNGKDSSDSSRPIDKI